MNVVTLLLLWASLSTWPRSVSGLLVGQFGEARILPLLPFGVDDDIAVFAYNGEVFEVEEAGGLRPFCLFDERGEHRLLMIHDIM